MIVGTAVTGFTKRAGKFTRKGTHMTNNNDKEKVDLENGIGIGPGRGSEREGKAPGSGKIDQGKQAGGRSKGTDDPENTAGGREGNFEESKREDEDQWSPGSNQSSDQ